ncbi:Multiple epidermal growth factor-like domains protein 11 [Hondaea fermentalgiana]|uniref:Multiple epidermal growth factor-like domains protein 11 n=1 Tax=Hondaea fermentalgiana TaxID=2315210 RepID=A0A2R5G9I3_9STRA|nr:Multiple epidermal growth factor-like domains protein 11 [Hondaea fermentalgiana]|eukprot:GBG27690.1 Multiple epidermal growth factor-like domains protein 11 [Hondaea fermentalgiana]
MQKAFLIAIAALAVIPATVRGACPNSCSGHGRCGTDDVCACYPNWMSGDCSERRCPYTKAWADVPDITVSGRDAHHYAECGNRGTCDRSVGECVCDDGFEGEGCERLSCPGGNTCNGHGTCELMNQVNELDLDGSTTAAYAGWDATKVQVCVCDPGYEGYNCMDRKCKLGDDPLTLYSSTGVAEINEEQTITLTVGTGFKAGSQFLLGYTDWRGETWITRPIDVATTTLASIAVKEALLSLPQRAIDDIEVNVDTDTTASKVISVTFTSLETPGDQPLLTLYTDGCTSDGCQPYYAGVLNSDDAAPTTATVAVAQDGTGERTVCSSRGICDTETGVCSCFDGFYGQACEKQTLVQ